MLKSLCLIAFLLIVGGHSKEIKNTSEFEHIPKSETRQKRLLFYDEDGNIVKTYNNPLRDFGSISEKIPFFSNFWNPFFALLQPTKTFSASPPPFSFMIPVSEEVIQQLNNDPIYQNKLIFRPREPVIELNPSCLGKRAPIPSPRFCSNFVNCWDGWAFEQECPDGLLFSYEGFCDYPDKVDCNNRWLRVDPEPKCHKDFETFRNELKCNEFFVCVNRLPVRFKCPADLAFNQNLGICDYPQRVNCSVLVTHGAESMSDDPLPATEAAATVSTPAFQTVSTLAIQAEQASTSESPPHNNVKTSVLSDMIFNSWSTSHIAISRQDAIRQLQLKSIANVKPAY